MSEYNIVKSSRKAVCEQCGLYFWRLRKNHKLCKKCFLNTLFSTLDIGGNRIYL